MSVKEKLVTVAPGIICDPEVPCGHWLGSGADLKPGVDGAEIECIRAIVSDGALVLHKTAPPQAVALSAIPIMLGSGGAGTIGISVCPETDETSKNAATKSIARIEASLVVRLGIESSPRKC
jgi:hypothetical protein